MKNIKLVNDSIVVNHSSAFLKGMSSYSEKTGNNSMLPIRVLMIGESLNNCGGVVEVQKIILKRMNEGHDGISIHHIAEVSSHRDGPFLPKLATFVNALIILTYKLIYNQFDIAHVHFTERGSIFRVVFIASLCKLGRKPYILHSHGAEFKDFFLELPKTLQRIVSYYLAGAASILVLSEAWKNYFVQDLGLDESKIDILLNPVELPSEIPSLVDTAPMKVIFLGRIGHRKGSFDLIQAFAKAKDRFDSPVALQMAGDGEVEKAKQLVKSLKLEGQIQLLGWVNQEQRNQILSEATLFVLPSYNEGLPLSVLEAMSWGLPVITTPVGGIPDVIEHGKNGLLVTPGNVENISEALIQLVNDKIFRTQLGAQAKICVQAFSAHDYCLRMKTLYQRSMKYTSIAGH